MRLDGPVSRRKWLIVGITLALALAVVISSAVSRRDTSSPRSTLTQQAHGESIYGITPAGGVLYLGSGNGVIAFDLATRSARWRFVTHGQPVMLAPTLVDGRIYFGSHDTVVYAIDLDGNVIWWYDIDNWVFGSPAVDHDTVYAGSAARFVALDAATGIPRWTIDLGTWVEVSWSREVVDGVIYLGTVHGELIAVDAATGVENWRFRVPSATDETGATPLGAFQSLWIHDPPVVADGAVYFASMDEHVYAVDATTGKQLWRFAIGGWVYPSPVVVDGTVYAASNGGFLYALDAGTGDVRWKSPIAAIFSPITVADGIVYASYDRAHARIGAFDASTGERLWEYAFSDAVYSEFSRPVVQSGVVYVGDRSVFGQGLFALDAKTGVLLWRALAPPA